MAPLLNEQDFLELANSSGCAESLNSSVCNSTDLSGALLNDKVYSALLMIPLPLVAVVGNILVILSVYKEKSLQTATNYFIISLAFADLLVAAVVMPFAVYVLVNVDWELSETLCDFYIALDVTCSTASIFNLVAISIDRFIAVTQPIQYSKHQNNKRIFTTIAVVWLVSAAIGSPIVMGLNTSPERIPNLCVFYNSDFIIYSSLSSFYIPCIVMIYLYYKIFKAIHERTKKAIGNNAQPKPKADDSNKLRAEADDCSHHARISKSELEKPSGLPPLEEVDENRVKLHAQDDCRKCHEIDLTDIEVYSRDKDGTGKLCSREKSGTNNLIRFLSPHRFAKRKNEETRFSEDRSNTNFDHGSSLEIPLKVNGEALSTSSPVIDQRKVSIEVEDKYTNENDLVLTKEKKRPKFTFVKHRKSSKKREKNAARRERKATKTLAIVLGVFLICWVPFFTCNILDAICIKLETDNCRPGVTAFLLTTWLGYVNSCVNPVIYTIFNVEFRKAFKKLLSEPCK